MNLEKHFVKRIMRQIRDNWKHGKLQPRTLCIMAATIIMVDRQFPDIWELWAQEVLEEKDND